MLYFPETTEEKDFNEKFARFINGENIIPVSGEINRAIRDLERNGNGRIIFMDLALRLSVLIRKAGNSR